MVTQILPFNSTFLNAPMPLTARQNPFLEALHYLDYGSITILTPEGDKLHFKGRVEGPQATLAINDWGVFEDLIARGEIGLAEAYMEGRWNTIDLTSLLTFGLVNNHALEKFFHGKPLFALWLKIKGMLRGNSISGSARNIIDHYDLGNDFYELWLDKSMTYSCGLFKGDRSKTLEQAQQDKYQRILNKLEAAAGDHILEIGCGWGGFAMAAARHGIRVTSITISPSQAEFARERIAAAGLSDLAKIQLTDYREVKGQFDHIVSIGMFEHVGKKFWPDYFRTIKKHLKPEGNAMVQSITIDGHLFEELPECAGFIETYIFPGGMLPSKYRFEEAAVKEGLRCHELFTFGDDYAITLRHWLARFEAHRGEVLDMGYDDRFIRMWRFYLCSCMAAFISRRTDVMQVHLTHQY